VLALGGAYRGVPMSRDAGAPSHLGQAARLQCRRPVCRDHFLPSYLRGEGKKHTAVSVKKSMCGDRKTGEWTRGEAAVDGDDIYTRVNTCIFSCAHTIHI